MSQMDCLHVIGSLREDDWTCSSYGNVNYSFRMTCNKRSCTQPRPADHNIKSALKLAHVPKEYSSLAPYTGSGAPTSVYLSLPPFGSSIFNGPSIPPYDIPFSGVSTYQYNNSSQYSPCSPYRPLYFSGPGAYSNGSMMRTNMTHESVWSCPKCGNITFAFRTVCNIRKCNKPRPGSQVSESDKNSQHNPPKGSWKCEKCNNLNYPFRTNYKVQQTKLQS